MFASDELNDLELSEVLSMWIVPDPPQALRTRIFSRLQSSSIGMHDFAFDIPAGLETPWYKSLISNLRDWIRPPQLASLRVTSKPLAVGNIWGTYAGGKTKSGALSVLVHAGVVALLFLAFQPRTVQEKAGQMVTSLYLTGWKPKLPPPGQISGGGGGGQHMSHPVTKGAAPQFRLHQFILPPQAIPQPKLPVIPTVTAPAPQINAEIYGDPLSKLVGNSGGAGTNGFGSGSGGGIGSGNGEGYGPGNAGGTGGAVYRIGGEVSTPVLISKIEPEYSEEARKAKYSGTVLLSVIIDANGHTRDIHVVRPLGLGLDEKAIEAVSKWRFRPAMRGGRPVPVQAQVEVNFRLL